jgi:hypothetical protein
VDTTWWQTTPIFIVLGLGSETRPRGLSFSLARPNDHPPIYYPGVTRPSEAQKVRLSAGQEARVDLSLRPVKLLALSGRVVNPNGKPATGADVILTSQDGETEFMSPHWNERTDAQGSFAIKDVQPGPYKVSAQLREEDNQYWTEQPVEVAGKNVSGLQLQLTASVKLSGKVTVAGGSKLDLHSVRVTLFAAGEGWIMAGYGAVNQDGTFTVAPLRRTTHYLELSGLPDGWYLRSAVCGDQYVLDNGLNLADGDSDHLLELTISPGVARLRALC